MDVAASVVGFIGITGQILQRCKFLHTFFKDYHGATVTILDLADEFNRFQQAVAEFHGFLYSVQNACGSRLLLQETSIMMIRSVSVADRQLEEFLSGFDADPTEWRRITGKEWCTACRCTITVNCYLDATTVAKKPSPGAWPADEISGVERAAK